LQEVQQLARFLEQAAQSLCTQAELNDLARLAHLCVL
jgi:hypothetical protein